MDVQAGAVLGQHALAYTLLSFFAITIHRRLLWFTVPSQAVQILPLFFAAHAVSLVVRMISGGMFPGWQVLLAPVFSIIWTRLDQSRFALPDTAKQALGMIVLGLGFIVMTRAQNLADTTGPVGPQWLAAVFAIHTIGELMLSPVGLSMVSRVAPARLASLMMGVWFLSSAAAGYLSGTLEQMLHGSSYSLWPFLTAMSIGSGVLLLLITPLLSRLMGLKRGV